MQKILITGGAGFIGTHLAERLCNYADIVLFDNMRRDSLKFAGHLLEKKKVRLVLGDVLKTSTLDEVLDGVDTILHLAAIAGVSSYYNEPLRTLQVNILGTVNVLEAAVKNKVKQFIDFSTSEVYGAEAEGVNENSRHGIGPSTDLRWTYATSKLASEHFTLRYAQTYGFTGVVVRPFNIYGPRQIGEGAVSNFCRAAIKKNPLVIYGDGTCVRAWCYVSDLVDAVEAILLKPSIEGMVFNIGNPYEVENTAGLARRIATLAGDASVTTQETNRAEVRTRIPSIDRARDLLGYEPKVGLDEGLKQTFAWFKREHPE